MQDEWLTTTDIAKILKCGRQTVKEYMSRFDSSNKSRNTYESKETCG